MPINHKQQAFINEYMVNGHNATQAYKKAYPDAKTGHRQNGARLIANDNVSKAIKGLMAKIGRKAEFTMQQYQDQLRDDRALAISLNQPSAAVSASVAMGRSCGYDKETVHTKTETKPITAEHQPILEDAARDLKLRLA